MPNRDDKKRQCSYEINPQRLVLLLFRSTVAWRVVLGAVADSGVAESGVAVMVNTKYINALITPSC